MKILVTGATGHFGHDTIHSLLNKGVAASQIVALVRDEAKALHLQALGIALRKGDYDNYEALKTAFTGIDKLLLVSGTDIANRQQQHENAINAAKEAGVKHIVYTSFARKNEQSNTPLGAVALSHIATDKAIKASGIPYTILLNGLYADALPMFLGEKVLETGVFFPAGEGKTAFTLRADMAEAAAVVLSGEGHEQKEYVLTSEANLSFQDIADTLSNLSGKKVGYINPPIEVFKAALAQAGVPDMYIGFSLMFAEAIRQGEFEVRKSDLEQLIGRKATELEVFLKQAYILPS